MYPIPPKEYGGIEDIGKSAAFIRNWLKIVF
jgi:hypothetical protein